MDAMMEREWPPKYFRPEHGLLIIDDLVASPDATISFIGRCERCSGVGRVSCFAGSMACPNCSRGQRLSLSASVQILDDPPGTADAQTMRLIREWLESGALDAVTFTPFRTKPLTSQ